MHKPLRTLVNTAIISVLATGTAHAAGFSLYGESAGYAVGNYAAGSAAEAFDATTGWYNPAGLALIREQQVVFGGIGIFPTLKLNGTSTFTTIVPPNPPVPPITLEYVQNFEGVDGSYNAFVPSLAYALPLGERTTFGFTVTAPFGLSTDWQPNSPVRYAATYTEVLTADFSPELGTRLTDNIALGAGLDIEWSRVKFNQMVGVPTLLQVFGDNPMAFDSLSYNKGTSWGVGFHVGVMGIFNDNHTRIGINYQSRIRHVFYGYSKLTGILANEDFVLVNPMLPPSGVWKNNDLFSNPQQFPDVLTISGYQDINERLAILGSIVYTGWHVFKTIQLNNVVVPNIVEEVHSAPFPPIPLPTVEQANVNINVPQNFHDAWRASIGANYWINPQLMLRVGGGYDQTPTNNTDRNIRLPDVDRWAIAFGAHYQWRHNIGIDVGYTHLFPGSNPSINSFQQLSETSSYNVDADGGSFAADLVGAQLTWIIDKVPEAPMK